MKHTNYLKSFIIALALSGAAAAVADCGKKPGKADDSAAWSRSPVKVGDVVVVRDTQELPKHHTARVLKIDGERIKVKLEKQGFVIELPRSQAYKIPKGRTTMRVKVGDPVVFHHPKDWYWNEGVVDEVGSNFAQVRTHWGEVVRVRPNGIVQLTPEQAQGVLRRRDGRTLRKAAEGKYPDSPPKYKPKKGERVIAIVITSGSWYTGTSVDDEGNTYQWDDPQVQKHRSASKPVRVSPLPKPADAPKLKPNDYVLVKNPDPKKHIWHYAKVLSGTGTTVKVLTQYGRELTTTPGAYVPLK